VPNIKLPLLVQITSPYYLYSEGKHEQYENVNTQDLYLLVQVIDKGASYQYRVITPTGCYRWLNLFFSLDRLLKSRDMVVVSTKTPQG
jgi:hypothetical protein